MCFFFICVGLFRLSVIQSFLRARSGGFSGNIEGDGTLLGATLVMGPGEQGILFQYQAIEFGDHASIDDISTVIENISHEI